MKKEGPKLKIEHFQYKVGHDDLYTYFAIENLE
jgi:hypothetical protein